MTKHHTAKQAFIQLNNTANWLQGQMAELLEPFQISVQQLRTLAIVADMPERRATVNQIREKMFDPSSNVSRLLNKLMEKQLIRKVRSQTDQRVVHIQMTRAGETLLQGGQQALDQGLGQLACLTTEQFEQLIGLLTQLRGS